jgi:pimeloyl-ACP methyl ester carboxylesterase
MMGIIPTFFQIIRSEDDHILSRTSRRNIMSKLFRILMITVMLGASFPVITTSAQDLPRNCTIVPQDSGAVSIICIPMIWNGDLVVYAHGYVSPTEDPGIPWNQLILPDGTSIIDLVRAMGYAFAASGYSKNGLAVKEGLEDTLDLVEIFKAAQPEVNRVYVTGVSEGGLIATLGVEQHPNIFAGGMAACGPTGDFRKQIDYIGDGRTVFDYFFPGVLPGSPIAIPDELIDNWDTDYAPAVAAALTSNPDITRQYLRVTRLPVDPANPESGVASALGVLWYNVFGTNDAIDTLGGQPYDNMRRIYFGSNNDLRLNRLIQRFPAAPEAIAEINTYYQTSGRLASPLVNLHTTRDPVVPYWHASLYGIKVLKSGSYRQYIHIPVFRYGHCSFTPAEVLFAFALMVYKATGFFSLNIEEALPDKGSQQEYMQLAEEHGLLDNTGYKLYLSIIVR